MQGRLENEMKIQSKIDLLLKDLPPYVSEWFMNLKASRTTMSTCLDYVKKIKQFLKYIDKNVKQIDVKRLDTQAVESFMISIQVKKGTDGMMTYTSDSYQITFWFVLNNFFEFLVKCKYVELNPMENIKRPKNNDLERINNERIQLTKKDFNNIIKAALDSKSTPVRGNYRNRDCLILLLLMTTGMRETALSEINLSDIDFETNILTIVDKGNKTHTYPLNEQVMKYLKKWLKDRSKIVEGNRDELFIGNKGERLTAVGITRVVQKYSKAGIGKKLSPHKLRSGFCSILYNETHDAEFVRRAVGHRSITTTQRYIKTKEDEKEKAAKIISGMIKI